MKRFEEGIQGFKDCIIVFVICDSCVCDMGAKRIPS
jgi:hypothetical protein